MTLWAILALHADWRQQSNANDARYPANKEVTAIDQEALGRKGDRVYAEGPVEIWTKPQTEGRKAIAIFDFGVTATEVSLHLRNWD